MMTVSVQDIAQIQCTPLFSGLEEQGILAVLTQGNYHELTHPKGSMVYSFGETQPYAYILLEGVVQMYKDDAMGNRAIISKHHAPATFGNIVAFARQMTPVYAMAETACRTLRLDLQKVLLPDVLPTPLRDQLLSNLLFVLASSAMRLERRVATLSKKTARERIIEFFVFEHPIPDDLWVQLAFSRHEMADYLCIDRSALSRELSKMRDEGLLEFDKLVLGRALYRSPRDYAQPAHEGEAF